MDNINKMRYLERMAENLPLLRCKLGISQNKLAEIIGVGRSTITNIENRKRLMTWNMFLSLLFVFSNNNDTKNLLLTLDIFTDELNSSVFISNK